MRWPLQPLQPFQQTQLQPPFGQSVDSLCHPWFTTTNVSYRFPILKLPPPPCAVLLVIVYTHNKSKTKTSWNHSEVTPRDVLRWQVVPKVATMIPHCLHIDGKTEKKTPSAKSWWFLILCLPHKWQDKQLGIQILLNTLCTDWTIEHHAMFQLWRSSPWYSCCRPVMWVEFFFLWMGIPFLHFGYDLVN